MQTWTPEEILAVLPGPHWAAYRNWLAKQEEKNMTPETLKQIRYAEHDQTWTPAISHPHGRVLRPEPQQTRLVLVETRGLRTRPDGTQVDEAWAREAG